LNYDNSSSLVKNSQSRFPVHTRPVLMRKKSTKMVDSLRRFCIIGYLDLAKS
jgi:hypothetical protein